MKGRTNSLPSIEVHIPHVNKLHESRKSSPLNLHKININHKNYQTVRRKNKNNEENENKVRLKNNFSIHLLKNNSIMNSMFISFRKTNYGEFNLPKIEVQKISPKVHVENNTFKSISTQYNLDFKALLRKSFAETIDLNHTIKKAHKKSGPFLITMRKLKTNLLPFLETNFEDQYREQELFLNIRKINFPILSRKSTEFFCSSNKWRPMKRGCPPKMDKYKYKINIEEYQNYSPFKDQRK